MAVASPRAGFGALADPTFRGYWIVSWISSTGDGMENVIRNWLVLQLAGDAAPLWLGLMVFAHWVPFTFFSLGGGVLADRHDNRKLQILAQILLFSAAAAVAVATLTGTVTLWWMFGLLLIHGLAGAIGSPAQQTLIHSIVGPERLVSAISMNNTARQLSQVIGPAIAGLILVTFGPGWGFLVNALTFLPLLVFLALVRVRRRGGAPLSQPMLPALAEGVKFVRGRPLIAGLISAEMLTAVFLGHTFTSLIPVFATKVLGVGALGYSLLLVGSGLGAVGAGAYLAWSRRRGMGGRFIVTVFIIQTLAVLAFGFSASYALSFGLLVAIGFCTVVAQTLTNTTIQLAAPDRLRGRVMGAYSFGTQGVRVLNGPLLGGAAVLVGVPLAVSGAAALVVAALMVLGARVPDLRRNALPA